MPRVDSRQASLTKLIWFTLLCYSLCRGDKKAYISQFQMICNVAVGKQMRGYLAPPKLRFKRIFNRLFNEWKMFKVVAFFKE